MKSKEITICGKKVMLAYCYATEIAFHGYTEKDFTTFINESYKQQNISPNYVMYAIISAIFAYYEAHEEESPIVDNDLMFHATPEEIKAAFIAVTQLYREWYNLPAGEQEKNTEDDPKRKRRKGKNS
jgi:hypothetical protein